MPRRSLLIIFLSFFIILIACISVVVPIVIVNATKGEDNIPDEFTNRVKTTRGTVRGFHVDYGMIFLVSDKWLNNTSLGSDRNQLFFGAAEIFLGLPFAQPPVDELRFQVSLCILSYVKYVIYLPRPVCKYYGEVGELEYKYEMSSSSISRMLALECHALNRLNHRPIPSLLLKTASTSMFSVQACVPSKEIVHARCNLDSDTWKVSSDDLDSWWIIPLQWRWWVSLQGSNKVKRSFEMYSFRVQWGTLCPTVLS